MSASPPLLRLNAGMQIYPRKSNHQAGFTLIELMIVIGLLAVVGGGILVAYQGARNNSESILTKHRLANVRSSLLKFRQDMGYFPGEGPLGITATVLPQSEAVPEYHALPTSLEQSRWLTHELNFWMLHTQPIDSTAADFWDWDDESQRGWNGPYLSNKAGMLLTNAGDLASDFEAGNVTDNLLALDDAATRDNGKDSNAPLFWEIRENREISDNAKIGRPIALVTDETTFDNPATPEADVIVWVLVSFGKNGIFEFTSLNTNWGDDEVVEVKRVLSET